MSTAVSFLSTDDFLAGLFLVLARRAEVVKLTILSSVAPVLMTKVSRRGKKRGRQNQGSGNVPMRVKNIGTVVPDRILITMPYGEMIQRSPAATTDLYTFRLNSTFDPDLTGTGHQPLGRDQFAGVLYNRYRVHGVRVVCDFSAFLAADVPILAYMYFSNGYSLSTITDALEQPYIVTKFMGNASYGYSSQLRQSAMLWNIWGKTKEQYLADDITGAIYNANPSEVINVDIGVGSCNRTTNISEWRFAIRIEYLVEWYDRVQIGAS